MLVFTELGCVTPGLKYIQESSYFDYAVTWQPKLINWFNLTVYINNILFLAASIGALVVSIRSTK